MGALKKSSILLSSQSLTVERQMIRVNVWTQKLSKEQVWQAVSTFIHITDIFTWTDMLQFFLIVTNPILANIFFLSPVTIH